MLEISDNEIFWLDFLKFSTAGSGVRGIWLNASIVSSWWRLKFVGAGAGADDKAKRNRGKYFSARENVYKMRWVTEIDWFFLVWMGCGIERGDWGL